MSALAEAVQRATNSANQDEKSVPTSQITVLRHDAQSSGSEIKESNEVNRLILNESFLKGVSGLLNIKLLTEQINLHHRAVDIQAESF